MPTPEYTENLNLLKKDPIADASDTFNIQTMMNDNWDKIDAAALKVQPAKAAPVDADRMPLVDSADSSKSKLITWANIKTALSSVFAALSHTHTKSEISDFPTSMTPTAHAASHKTGGADTMTASDIGAAAASHTHGNITSAGQISGVTLDATLVRLVSGVLQTLGGTAVDTLKIATGSYTGTGLTGSSNPITLNFGINSKLLFWTRVTGSWAQPYGFVDIEKIKAISNANMYVGGAGSTQTQITRSGDDSSDLTSFKYFVADIHLNAAGDIYYWTVIGE